MCIFPLHWPLPTHAKGNTYSPLPSMLLKRIQRNQLQMVNACVSMVFIQILLSLITPIHSGCSSEQPKAKMIENDLVETDVPEEACDLDNADSHQDHDVAVFPAIEDNLSRYDILLNNTNDNQKVMVQQDWVLLDFRMKLQTEQTGETIQLLTKLNHSLFAKRLENLRQQNKFWIMAHPVRYHRGAKELYKILTTLRLNIASHMYLFTRGDNNQVKYAVSFLHICNHHSHLTQQNSEHLGPSEWAGDQWEAQDTCSKNLKLLVNKLQKTCRDKDQCLNSATIAIYEDQQPPHTWVLVNTNCLKGNWRTVDWGLEMHKAVHYNMAWAHVPHALKTNIRTCIFSNNGRFDKFNNPFTVPCRRSWIWMTTSLEYINTDLKWVHIPKGVIWMLIPDHLSQTLRTSLPVVATILPLITANRARALSPVEAAERINHKQHVCKTKSPNAIRHTRNKLTAAMKTSWPKVGLNWTSRTDLNKKANNHTIYNVQQI